MPWDRSEAPPGPAWTTAGRDASALGPSRRVAGGAGLLGGSAPWCARRVPGVRGRPERLVAAVPARRRPAGRERRRPAGRRRRSAAGRPAAEFHAPDWVLGQATLAELADGSLVLPDARATGGTTWSGWSPARPRPAGRAGLVPRGGGPALREHRRCGGPGRRPTGRRAAPGPGRRARLDAHRGPGGLRGAGRARAGRRCGRSDRAGSVVAGPADVSAAGPSRPRPRPDRSPVSSSPRPTPGCPGRAGAAPAGGVLPRRARPASAEPGFDPVVQFFTSRGLAVAAVDYRGSSGYGRAYRQGLAGRWGEADIDDCVAYRRRPWPRPAWWTAAAWPSGGPVPAGSPPSAP